MANGNGLTAKEMTVLRLIDGAARSGRCCPGNRVLADVLGSRDIAGMSRIVRRLDAKGWIAVEPSLPTSLRHRPPLELL